MNWRYSIDRVMKQLGSRRSGGWRIENPHSFINDFDSWFAYECFVVGFCDDVPAICQPRQAKPAMRAEAVA